jgi:RimJ/RimL family protein N-acetyltransferase
VARQTHGAQRTIVLEAGLRFNESNHNPVMPSFADIVISTRRLLLRPLVQADAPALFEIFSDPRVARHLSAPAWPEAGLAQARITKDMEAMGAGKYICLGIERLDDNKLVGECSLFNLVEQCRRAEIGYALAYAAWSQGYVTEALVSLLSFGFERLGLNRVEADIDPRNIASAKSLERLGFKKEGHLRERWIVNGEVSDSGLYGLLASDWQSRGTLLRGC